MRPVSLCAKPLPRFAPILVCSPGGYLEQQGYALAPMRAPIPHIARLLAAWREKGWPVFHTREGHRPDMSDCSARELFRSRGNPSGLGKLAC